MHEAAKFIELLTGNKDTKMHWVTYYDPDKSRNNEVAKTVYAKFEDMVPIIKLWQRNKQGVTLCINETDGIRRLEKNITKCRAVFIDGDDIPLPTVWPISPNIIVSRDATHWHCYWLLYGADFEWWKRIQHKVACFYNVKDPLTDLNRVMRCPGFYHFKDPNNPKLYTMTWYQGSTSRYSLESFENNFILNTEQQARHQKWLDECHNIPVPEIAEAIYEESDMTINRFRFRLSSIVPEKGDYNNTIYKVATIGKDLGLREEVLRGEITAWWVRSLPIPVEPHTIHTVVSNAYKYGVKTPGCKTTQGIFSAAPDIDPKMREFMRNNPPPIVLETGSDIDLNKINDEINASDEKFGKNHTINARMFLEGAKANNMLYATVKQETYVYKGTHWSKLEEKELEQIVHATLIKSRPAAETIAGTCKIIKLMTGKKAETIPAWIDKRIDDIDIKNIIIFKNGILDIKNNRWMEHTPALFYTHCLKYDYDESATAHNWQKWLMKDTFNNDLQMVNTLQEWFGYLLVNNYDFQKFAVLIGAPRSGKGTILRVIRHIIGEHNCAAPRLSKLSHDSILNSMSDKPVAIIGDAHKVPYAKRDEVLEIIKMITGNDSITFDRKFINASTAKFPSRFTIAANKMPDFIDTSGALASRIILIVFKNSYEGREDPRLYDNLIKESPGILNWAIAGYKRLRIAGRFTQSGYSTEMLNRIREEISPILGFMNDCVEVTGQSIDAIPCNALYQIYKRWCAMNDTTPMKTARFRQDLLSASYSIGLTRRQIQASRPRVFTGLQVSNDLSNVAAQVFDQSI